MSVSRWSTLYSPRTITWRMRPTAPDKRRLISNYDEVAAHIAPALAKLAEPRGPRW